MSGLFGSLGTLASGVASASKGATSSLFKSALTPEEKQAKEAAAYAAAAKAAPVKITDTSKSRSSVGALGINTAAAVNRFNEEKGFAERAAKAKADLAAVNAKFTGKGRGSRKSRKLGSKFSRCVKSVRKTVKARPKSSKESAAIAICTKSVLHTRGRTMKRYRKGRLTTQKKH